ncbi:MAG: hypothetical protein JSV06_10665 [Myxococcales bacterium]|nr:MAG: hypothetical protein JSV06_10665 [Myxococcales bacterium]
MKSKKSQGPSRAALVASAVILSAVLVGSAYFSRDENARSSRARPSPAASTLQPLFERCDGEPTVEVVDGLTRTTCTCREHPTFMIHTDVDGEAIERAGLMVPMYGREQDLEERKLVGLELFSLIAGAPAETFLPPEQLAEIGVRQTRFTHKGLTYATQPVGNVGLVFSVNHAPPDAASEN